MNNSFSYKMNYSLSLINLDYFLTSNIKIYNFIELKIFSNTIRLFFNEINDSIISLLELIGVYNYDIIDLYFISIPYIKIERDYYNIIWKLMDSNGFQFRTFSLPNLENIYHENPYMIMYKDNQLIHIHTLNDNNFIIQKNQYNYCCLCQLQNITIKIRDFKNDQDELHICKKCCINLLKN